MHNIFAKSFATTSALRQSTGFRRLWRTGAFMAAAAVATAAALPASATDLRAPLAPDAVAEQLAMLRSDLAELGHRMSGLEAKDATQFCYHADRAYSEGATVDGLQCVRPESRQVVNTTIDKSLRWEKPAQSWGY